MIMMGKAALKSYEVALLDIVGISIYSTKSSKESYIIQRLSSVIHASYWVSSLRISAIKLIGLETETHVAANPQLPSDVKYSIICIGRVCACDLCLRQGRCCFWGG